MHRKSMISVRHYILIDSTHAGRVLRLKQQYFFVCAGLNSIIRAHLRVYPDLTNFHEKNVIQLNDTHPVLVIPELMRVFIDDYNMEWDDAWNIVCRLAHIQTIQSLLKH